MLLLVKLVISIFIFFGGFGVYVCEEYYPQEYIPTPTWFDDECGSTHFIKVKGVPHQNYLYALNEDVIYYTRRGSGQEQIFYCIYLNQTSQECRNWRIWKWHESKLSQKITEPAKQGEWFLKLNILVIEPFYSSTYTFGYNVNIQIFNFPSYSLYFNNEEHLKVLFNYQHGDWHHDDDAQFYVYFVDENDKCGEYRPRVLQRNEMMNVNLYLNRKWTKYAYYFIKKENFVCSYSFEYLDFFQGDDKNIVEIHHVGFNLIDNYPTENYAPNFFCIDPLYGTFVSLYWNQQQPNALPEAHFYIINENNIKNIRLIDRLVLKKFDKDVLKDIFDNVFDREYLPTFVSYGRTIFIWFKRQSEARVFNGFWTDESVYETHFEEINTEWTLRKIFRSKKAYIQVDRPVGRMEVYATTPPPITSSPTRAPPPPQTTQLLTTTTEPLPSTLSTASTTSKQTTEQTTEQSTERSTAASSTESYEMSTSESNDHEAAAQTSNSDDCKYETYLWILIALICVDALLGIVLGILIAIKFRGAKKMKEAMAKRFSKRGHAKPSKKPALKEKTFGMPWKKKKSEESKMSTKEKSITTEDAAGGDKTVEAQKKTTTTVNQTTDYYTVNEAFDKK